MKLDSGLAYTQHIPATSTCLEMVEESRRRTNRYQISDFIKFIAIPKAVDPAIIRDLYLKHGFTASQIAEQVGLSKPAVLARLHQMGVRKESGKGEAVCNYRFGQHVPFGKRLVNGRSQAIENCPTHSRIAPAAEDVLEWCCRTTKRVRIPNSKRPYLERWNGTHGLQKMGRKNLILHF